MNKPTPKATAKVRGKELLRVYIRCADCAKTKVDPALRQLFVFWASPEVKSDEENSADDARGPATFALAKTDDGGFLSPPFEDTGAHPTKSVPVVAGVKYRFYFVRHPDIDYVRGILTRLNKAIETPKELKKFVDEFGEAKELEGKIEKIVIKGQKKSSLVFEIPEKPGYFIPRGSDLYDGWVLYRGMPGSGIVMPSIGDRKQAHLQCAAITKQVTRLQCHLGALRYPVGNQWHPYIPERWVKTRPHQEFLYPNEGMFEEVTWNAVLRFQSDAREGKAAVLDTSKARKDTLSASTYDPVPDPLVERELSDSLAYRTTKTTTLKDKPKLPYRTVVDAETGDAIRDWLDKGLRKPEKILVSLGQLDSWMHEDAYDTILDFSAELKSLGFKAGVTLNNGLRDVRMSVEVVGSGQAKRSIHKSGFAFDFAMDSYRYPRASAPLFFAPVGGAKAVEEMRKGVRMRWIVYALVRKSDIKTTSIPDYAEYTQKIDRWIYESTHPDGGQIRPTTARDAAKTTDLWDSSAAEDAYAFLNFTKVAESSRFGLTRIRAHGDGWQRVRPATVIKPTTLSSFAAVVSRLGDHIKPDALKFGPAGDKIRIGDNQYSLTHPHRDTLPKDQRSKLVDQRLQQLVAYFKQWLALTGTTGTSLTLRVEAWTPPGASIMKALTKSKALKDTKVDVIPELPSGPGKRERITLEPNAGFPAFYPFYVEPIPPIPLDIGTEVAFPDLPGHPAHMEWWHYQYIEGYQSKTWGEILGSIGWTEEGLTKVGPVKGNKPKDIYGFQGIGYKPTDLTKDAE